MTLNTLERSPKRSANQWTAPGLDCIESFRRFFEYEIDAANPIEMWFVTWPQSRNPRRGWRRPRLLMVVASAVNALVGQVLDGLDAGVRARFNRAGILFAVDDLGCATTLCDLREMFSLDGRRQDCNW